MTKPAKSQPYRWRPSPRLQAELAAAAKADRTTVDAILTRLVREWLAKRPRQLTAEEDAEEQRRLHAQARKVIGAVSIGLGPYTNRRVREVMGEALEKKHGESQRRAPRRSR
jgi:hypothetical protein